MKQKYRSLGQEGSASFEEVDKLKDKCFIHDALYPDWGSNPILVKKANGK